MSGTEAGGRLAPPSVRWQAGEAVDFGGFEVGALLANELEELDLEADLAALPEECCVQLLRVSGATKFPPAWESVAGMLQRRDGCLAEAIRDRPFWGQVEYFESDTVMDAVIAFLCPNESVPAEP